MVNVESVFVPLLAKIYRPFLGNIRFIAVTGSCGKTTTKELIADILAQFQSTHRSFDSNNKYFSVARTILELRRRHNNCVLELGASGPGSLAHGVALVRPQISVITTIGQDHYKAFRSAEAAAVEKRQLVSGLATDGVAILNKDDPLVMAMADDCRGRVVTYGLENNADFRGKVSESRWPDQLSMNVSFNGEEIFVQTQLLGAHLATSVLAALATAVTCGIPLKKAATAITRSVPIFGRMSIERTEDGVTFIHDHFKAPLWTMNSVITYMGEARAGRTFIVIGTLSDYAGSSSNKYRELARNALEHVDQVVFCSRYAPSHLRKLCEQYPDRLRVFVSTREAADFIAGVVRPDDLVLLKGSHRADHLERVSTNYKFIVRCWRSSCGREGFCDECELRDVVANGDIH
ncbi:MAG: UDP-N-acetylmuramoyl-tripeptide--D-alanyl-D-alanine ligase [Gammaproteobacteria bacterium]|jgi:UDP-N-acetylmuramoyl-tripeptide--D-alanyl-D-alanine ligase